MSFPRSLRMMFRKAASDPWVLGLQMHQVQCERLLDKIGIAYNPDDKYRGASGKILRAPEKPEVLKV